MIEAELLSGELPAAVLALVVIAGEDVPPVEFDRLLGHFVVTEQANDPGHLQFPRGGADPVFVFAAEMGSPKGTQLGPGFEIIGIEVPSFLDMNHFREVLAQQAEGSADGDDVNRDKHAVEHQYAGVQGRVGRDIHSGSTPGHRRDPGAHLPVFPAANYGGICHHLTAHFKPCYHSLVKTCLKFIKEIRDGRKSYPFSLSWRVGLAPIGPGESDEYPEVPFFALVLE